MSFPHVPLLDSAQKRDSKSGILGGNPERALYRLSVSIMLSSVPLSGIPHDSGIRRAGDSRQTHSGVTSVCEILAKCGSAKRYRYKRRPRVKAITLLRFLKFFVLLLVLPACIARAGITEKPRKCILVFGAHADDVEALAGGTFAKYIAAGYEGIYVCVNNNTAGCVIQNTQNPRYGRGTTFTVSKSPQLYPVDALETIQVRQEEARNSAALYGATPVFLDFREIFVWQGRKECYIGSDEFHQYQPPGRQLISVASTMSKDVALVTELLKKYQPEIVIIHALGGDKDEHGNSAYLMYLAFTKAIAQGIPVGKLWMAVNGWLLDSLAQSNGRGQPDVQIDIRDYIKIKYEAFCKHVSQKSIFYKDYVERNQAKPEDFAERFITVLDYTK
jgi:LmbE family N-acetylglucosaminyl deacetylase